MRASALQVRERTRGADNAAHRASVGAAERDRHRTKGKTGSACPIGAPGLEGGRDRTFCGFAQRIRYGALIQGQRGNRLRKRYRAPSRAATTGLRATIPPMSHHLSATIARASRRSRLLAAALVMGLLLAACGDATPSVAPTSSAAAHASGPTVEPDRPPRRRRRHLQRALRPPSRRRRLQRSPEASADAESTAAYELIERQVAAIRGLQRHQARAAPASSMPTSYERSSQPTSTSRLPPSTSPRPNGSTRRSA